MGSLRRFNLQRIVDTYNTKVLFETGTWKGDSIQYSLNAGFSTFFSTEIMPEIAENAQRRFKDNPNVHVLCTDSISGLKNVLPNIAQNIFFWLDAHFPGAEEGVKDYNEESNESIKFPLREELEIIHSFRKSYNDVIFIDDLRIYEDGNYQSGNLPNKIYAPNARTLDFIDHLFGKTHIIRRSYENEGYLLIFPKVKFSQNALSFKSIYHLFKTKLRKKIF